jgi:hypothetical protein
LLIFLEYSFSFFRVFSTTLIKPERNILRIMPDFCMGSWFCGSKLSSAAI